MKVLVADKFEQVGLDRLERLGCDLTFDPDLSADTLPEAVASHKPDVLIVRSTRVSPQVFESYENLSVVVRAGAGYDTIDVASASEQGVFVANCPGKNSIAVAELAWGLILACDRRIPDQTADLRAGTWNKKEYSKGRGLYGRTLGVIGLGQIGRESIRRGRAFGMKIAAWSRSLTPEEAEEQGLIRCESPVDVARRSDVVTIHVAATPETKHLVNAEFCDALAPGAILVNTSRGSIVDEQALAQAIREKGVRAGLDVYATEPGSGQGQFEDPIVHEPGVFGTHHVGASTEQAQQAIALEAVRIIEQFMRTGRIENCVNLAASTPATSILTIRMQNRPGVLAHVFYILGQAGINIEEMENIIYEGAAAACARIHLDDAPDDELLVAIGANPHIMGVSVSTL